MSTQRIGQAIKDSWHSIWSDMTVRAKLFSTRLAKVIK